MYWLKTIVKKSRVLPCGFVSQFSLSLPHPIVLKRRKILDTRVKPCLWGGGMCDLKKALHMQMCRKTFVHA